MPVQDLNRKQLDFVVAYLNDPNATQAARKVGYGSPENQGPRLLRNARVAAEIDRRRAALAIVEQDRFDVTREKIIGELALLAFTNPADFLNPDGTLDPKKITRKQWATVREIQIDEVLPVPGEGEDDPGTPGRRKVRLKLYDKRAALVDLGNHLGLFDNTNPNAGDRPPPGTADIRGELLAMFQGINKRLFNGVATPIIDVTPDQEEAHAPLATVPSPEE